VGSPDLSLVDQPHNIDIPFMKKLSRIFSVLALLLCGCGTTHVIMVGQPRPAITPDAVRVYTTPPRHFARIAIINSSSGGSWAFTSRGQVDEAIARIKEKAAKVGANGVLLEAVSTTSSGGLGIGVGGFGIGGGRHHFYAAGGGGSFYGPILHKTVQATAIYVR
jgi:hypothetical protein